jgi:RNA polymerase sigma factor (sigma-70 family)
MASRQAGALLQHIRRQAGAPSGDAVTDRALIQRFAAGDDEAAFATLVRRHGPMVLRVCQRILGNAHDAEDAYQATFIVLARKAAALSWRESLAGWLHEVAYRLALKARTAAGRRRAHESLASGPPSAAPPVGEITLREAQAVLNEELNRLPEKLRTPLVLCYLEGLAQEQAARQAGWSLSTLKRRLRQGLALLQARLQRRGVALSAVLSVTLLGEARFTSAALLDAAARAGRLFRTGPPAGEVPPAAALAEGLLKTMSLTRLRSVVVLLLAAALAVGGGLGAFAALTEGPAPAEQTALAATPPDPRPRRDRLGAPLLQGVRLAAGPLQFDGPPLGVAFAPKGGLVAACGGPPDRTLRLWDPATGREIWRRQLACSASAVAFSPNGEAVAVACDDKTVRLCDPATGEELRRLVGHEGRVTSLVFTRDRKGLFTGGLDGTVRQWDWESGTEIRQFAGPGRLIRCLALSPDGTLLAAGCDQPHPGRKAHLSLWELPSGKVRRRMSLYPMGVQALAFAPDGRTLAAGGSGPIVLFDVKGGRPRLAEIDLAAVTELALVARLAFTPDGGALACGCRDGVVYLFDSASGKLRRRLAGLARSADICAPPDKPSGITSLAFAPDGQT